MDRVCVIGAGSSGIAACQVLAERGSVASKRHTIQVDFLPYMRTIECERRRGRRRAGGLLARRSHELRAGVGS